jgi:hypothetical protein
MISAPVVITGRSSRRYTTSVVRVEAWPTSRAISSILTPRWLIRLTNEVRSSRGVQADRHRQLALCRTVIAAHGGQVIAGYFDEGCRADRPWNRRPQGQALLAELSRLARPAGALVTVGPSRLLPRRPPAAGMPILEQLAFRQVLLMFADTGISARTAREYDLLGELLSGPAGGVPASGLAARASARDRQACVTRLSGRAGRSHHGVLG